MPPRQPLPAPRPTPNATPKPPKVQGPKAGLKPAKNRTPTHFGMDYYDPFNPLTNNQIGTMAHHTAQQQLNALLGAIPSAQTVSQPYQQAITGVQGLSGALGKDLGQVGQQAQASAVQNANATATGQNRAAIQSGSGQSFQADPAFAQQMALTQQAQQAAAAQAGTIHALDFNTKMGNALVARQNDVNAAKAKEPAYETAATQALQDQQFKAQTVKANLQLASNKAATTSTTDAARIQQGNARIKLLNKQLQTKINQVKATGANPNASLSKTYGYIVNQSGQPILDANGKRIPVAKTASAKGGGGAKNLASALSKGIQQAKWAYQNIASSSTSNSNPFAPTKAATYQPRKNYYDALALVEQTIIAQAPGLPQPQVVQHAQRIVNAIYPAGKYGRGAKKG